MTIITEQDLALAERLEAGAFSATVVANETLSPLMRAIILEADELEHFRWIAGQDVMVAVGDRTDDVRAGGVIRRRYTIRRHDPATRRLELDIVGHGDGPGAVWARAVASGDQVRIIGPRGKVFLAVGVDWHCFLGDESFLPASLAMTEAVPDGQSALVVNETETGAEIPFSSPACPGVDWVFRTTGQSGRPDALLGALESFERPPGTGHYYLGGEFHVVNQLRDTLRAGGAADDALSVKPYWRNGMGNAPHGEPDKS